MEKEVLDGEEVTSRYSPTPVLSNILVLISLPSQIQRNYLEFLVVGFTVKGIEVLGRN